MPGGQAEIVIDTFTADFTSRINQGPVDLFIIAETITNYQK